MDESDINKLFMKVAADAGVVSEDVRNVFAALVQTTLAYRDRMREDMHVVVTVEDVNAALDLLLTAMKTGRLPQTDYAVRIDLVKLWLDELKPYL